MTYQTSPARRRIMSSIAGKDTSPELLLRRELHRRGLRYRLHVSDLPGKPDIVFPRKKLAVFVHGCFWHNHPGCRYWRMPRNNETFWEEKFAKNRERDERNIKALQELGWQTLVVWECEINDSLDQAVEAVESALNKSPKP